MQTKLRNMLVILGIYLIAIIFGVITFYQFQNGSLIFRLLLADVSATLIIWIFSLILKNASLYDPYWSVIPPIILILTYFYLGNALSFSVFLMLLAVTLWAIRLTYNWASHWKDFDAQDWRYNEIRDKAPKLYFLSNLFGIQLFPTLIVFIQLIAATHFIALNPSFNFIILIGSLMMIIAAIIQLIADEQMRQFKKEHIGQKVCMDRGLWKYSRHPNYFGEVLFWWGLYVMYLGAVQTLDVYMVSPILMTGLFIFISIPWMERKILRTRPEYRQYQKEVSMFIPFFRKESESKKALSKS